MSASPKSLLGRLLSGSAAGNAAAGDVKNEGATGDQLVGLARSPVRGGDDCRQVIAEAAKLAMSERYAQALALISHASAEVPGDPGLLCARASTLYGWGRYYEALASYVQAEGLGVANATLDLELGWTYCQLGNLQSAETYLHKAVDADPEEYTAHFGLGIVLHARGRFVDAVASYGRGLELRPSEFDCLIGRGNARCQVGDAALGEADFRAALTIRPDSAMAWTNIGSALNRQGRDEEAIKAFERADALEVERGEDASNLPNLVFSLRDAGRTDESIEISARRLSLRPSSDAYYALALSLLTAGRLREGWEAHECRFWRKPQLSARQNYNRPMWNGQELHGKTLLVCCEQGVGDTIQFARYVPMLKSLGARVLVATFAGLQEFCRGLPGVDVVLEDGPLPPFDFYVHLMSLPRVFDTELTTVPADVPYVHADPERAKSWRAKIGSGSRLKVGLAWAGNPEHLRDRERSLALSALLPLWGVEGVEFFGLQKGGAEDEIASLPKLATIENLGPSLTDYCETAAAVSELDLVIAVDTSVAHLAGALGKPVWMLLPKPCDWRWLEGREDTPWYPTMRLFRQTQRRVWGDVVDRVKEALRERVREQGSAVRATSSIAHAPKQSVALTPRSGAPLSWKSGLAAFVEMRYGMLQYFPDQGIEAESIGWYGEYLQLQLEVLGRLAKPGSVMMEVGAGVGAHALLFARLVGHSGHLFLNEPRPIVQHVLRQNLGVNQIGNITILRNSLGRQLQFDRTGNDNSRESGEVQSGPACNSKRETIDELQLEQLHLLKVNNNTSASDVLDGASETIWRLRPRLFVSVPNPQGLRIAQDRAEQFSYHCWRVDTPLFNPGNFNSRDTDIFDGRSVSALLAIPEEIEIGMALDGCVEL